MKDYAFLGGAILIVIIIAYFFGGMSSSRPSIDLNTGKAIATDNAPLKFKTGGSYMYYPDLSFIVRFKKPPSDTFIRNLNAYNFAYAKKYVAYTDTITRDTSNGSWLIYYDFQATPYSKLMLSQFMQGINQLKGSENIERIDAE